MGQRDAGQRRRRYRTRHARNDFKGHAGLPERERLFPAAAEHEGSPPFSRTTRRPRVPPESSPRESRSGTARAVRPASRRKNAARAGRSEHALVDERIVKHEIGGAQPRHRRRVRSPGSPGPAPTSETCPITATNPPQTQPCRSAATRSMAELSRTAERTRGSSAAPRRARIACSAPRAARAPSRHRHAVCAATPHAAGAPRPPTHPDRGKHRIERLAQKRRQSRSLAARRNRQRHAVSAHDAAQEGACIRRIVDGVDEGCGRSAASAT